MKRIVVLLSILGLAVGLSAQTLEEIIAGHIQVKGGLEAIQAVQTIKVTGKTQRREMETPFTAYMKKPDKFRYETEFGGIFFIAGFDGVNNWDNRPESASGGGRGMRFMGGGGARMMGIPEIEGPLVNYQEKGNTVEFLGRETMEGTEVFKLRVTLKDGESITQYLDAEYYVILKETTVRQMQDRQFEMETVYSDYKEVNGLLIPFVSERRSVGGDPGRGGMAMHTVIASIEINLELDDALFIKPVN